MIFQSQYCFFLMFNWITGDTYQYLEPFNLVELCLIELLEIKLFDHLTMSKVRTDV